MRRERIDAAYIMSRVVAQECGFGTPCWLWQGIRNEKGYGRLAVSRKLVRTHRLSHEVFIGPIPQGYEIDHLCRNPPCCNPAHLEAVTPAENRRRRIADDRLKITHCVNGHPFAGSNLLIASGKFEGQRVCRACRAARARARRKARVSTALAEAA